MPARRFAQAQVFAGLRSTWPPACQRLRRVARHSPAKNLIHLAGPLDDVDFVELEPTELKGMGRPVTAVWVSAADEGLSIGQSPAATSDAATGDAPLPPELNAIVPLAGRSTELRWLKWHWRRARHGAGRTVVVSGPPGIGKTRLAAELARDAHQGGGTVIYMPAAQRVEDVQTLSVPTGAALFIVDDLDAAPERLATGIAELARSVRRSRALLLVTHRREAAAEIVSLAETVAPPTHRRWLKPLDPDALRTIVALYAGEGSRDVPCRE